MGCWWREAGAELGARDWGRLHPRAQPSVGTCAQGSRQLLLRPPARAFSGPAGTLPHPGVPSLSCRRGSSTLQKAGYLTWAHSSHAHRPCPARSTPGALGPSRQLGGGSCKKAGRPSMGCWLPMPRMGLCPPGDPLPTSIPVGGLSQGPRFSPCILSLSWHSSSPAGRGVVSPVWTCASQTGPECGACPWWGGGPAMQGTQVTPVSPAAVPRHGHPAQECI